MFRKTVDLILILMIVLTTSCGLRDNNNPEYTEASKVGNVNLDIVTTDKLLYFMTKDIVDDRHSVDYMFTDRDKIWNFKFTEDSLNNISRKDLLIYSGADFEPWIGNFIDKLGKSKVGVINASRGIKFIANDREVTYNDKTLEDNPYYWMNIDNYKITLLNIKNAIQDKDPQDRDIYEQNFSKALKDIGAFEKRYKDISEKLEKYVFVVDGDELDYFTKYNNFKTLKFYNFGQAVNSDTQERNEKTEEKLSEYNNIIFLYEKDDNLRVNQQIIEKYHMIPVNIIPYSDDLRYIDILELNAQKLEQITQK